MAGPDTSVSVISVLRELSTVVQLRARSRARLPALPAVATATACLLATTWGFHSASALGQHWDPWRAPTCSQLALTERSLLEITCQRRCKTRIVQSARAQCAGTCSAARPTPPAAAWTSTQSPLCRPARPWRACCAVVKTVGSMLARSGMTEGGSFVSDPATLELISPLHDSTRRVMLQSSSIVCMQLASHSAPAGAATTVPRLPCAMPSTASPMASLQHCAAVPPSSITMPAQSEPGRQKLPF